MSGPVKMVSKGRIIQQSEIAELIVSALNLEINPEQIDPEAPLFGEGLSLDSIDALELALEISRRYGIEIKADDEKTPRIFSSVRALTDFINETLQGR